MLIVETIGRIRREHLVKGKSIREVARDLKVSRNTVRKVLRSGETSFSYEREVQPRPKLGRWKAELDRLLANNAGAAARERLTLIRLFEALRVLGYDGGYDAVRRYARTWSRAHAGQTAEAFVPLSFAPGEAYQFDWSHEVVLMSGVTVTVKVAHLRLCHSRMMFARAYPRETQEMVFDAHERAFAFFKGACTRGIYDNMKTAVETVFVGKDRQYNRRFLQMCAHHLVDPVACTPASGWEKGQVENQVGLVRERFFTPRLRVKSYDELNAWLKDKCIAYAKAHPHPERPDRTVWEVFEGERPKLIAYRGRFDGFHALAASVSKICLVRFDNNKYSVNAGAQHGWWGFAGQPPRQRCRRGTTGDLRSRPDRTDGHRNATRLRVRLIPARGHEVDSACTGGSTGTPRAPLRQPRMGTPRRAGPPMDCQSASKIDPPSACNRDPCVLTCAGTKRAPPEPNNVGCVHRLR